MLAAENTRQTSRLTVTMLYIWMNAKRVVIFGSWAREEAGLNVLGSLLCCVTTSGSCGLAVAGGREGLILNAYVRDSTSLTLIVQY